MIDVKEVLRRWSAGQGNRKVAREAGVDRKTAARYTAVAKSLFELELGVCQAESGRNESLAREIDPDGSRRGAFALQIAAMLGLLVRPEGFKNASLLRN